MSSLLANLTEQVTAKSQEVLGRSERPLGREKGGELQLGG